MNCSARGCRKNKKCDQCRRQTWKNIDEMQRAGFNRRRSRLFNKERIEYRRWLKILRIGSLVAVCYDGKAGRAKACRAERLFLAQSLNCCAIFYRDADRGDAVGYYQGLADALEAAGVVADDKWIKRWWGSDLAKDGMRPRIEVTLTAI